MKKTYKQLTIEEREIIQYAVWNRKSVRTIAKKLGRSASTISRELKRNPPSRRNVYLPRLAQSKAKTRIIERGRRERLKNDEIRGYVKSMLLNNYSPEQIAGRIRIDLPGQKISYEAIYKYIYVQYTKNGHGRCIGDDLRIYLKRRHKFRHPRYVPIKFRRVRMPDAVSIAERPTAVELRQEIGHWEGDSIVSRQSKYGLNTLVERKSGLVFITKITDGCAETTANAVIRRLTNLPNYKKQTLTLDNGSENAGHKTITEMLGTKCYFARPYHSWERGSNENTNGLIRYYFPKKTDFATITDEQIKRVETILNNRPRKRLKWLTPLEVFYAKSVALTG